jgi:small basic protein
MTRIAAFFGSTWLAAAALYLGRHSVGVIALSAVLVFAGLDLFRPE